MFLTEGEWHTRDDCENVGARAAPFADTAFLRVAESPRVRKLESVMAGQPETLTRRKLYSPLRLFSAQGRVLARETIVADVWPDDSPSLRVADTTLKRKRKKLPGLGRRIRPV